jgi:nucleotidyltransferase substrate binding protein (TIGR01987 family)
MSYNQTLKLSDRAMQRFETFTSALDRLQEVATIFKDDSQNAIIRDSLVQRYEFTIELAWKLQKDIAETEGVEVKSPKEAISQAYKLELIDDYDTWSTMLIVRNTFSHMYDEVSARDNAELVLETYTQLLKEFKDKVVKMYITN